MNSDILLYTLTTCSHCRALKNFLTDKGFDYESIDVDMLKGEERKDAINEVKKYNPRVSFPTIIIDDTAVAGFKKDKIENLLGELK